VKRRRDGITSRAEAFVYGSPAMQNSLPSGPAMTCQAWPNSWCSAGVLRGYRRARSTGAGGRFARSTARLRDRAVLVSAPIAD
jgi:hypothetical protein